MEVYLLSQEDNIFINVTITAFCGIYIYAITKRDTDWCDRRGVGRCTSGLMCCDILVCLNHCGAVLAAMVVLGMLIQDLFIFLPFETLKKAKQHFHC